MPVAATFNAAVGLVFKSVIEAGRAEELHDGLKSFATSSGLYDHLFRGAGPKEDGTVEAERVAQGFPWLR